MQIPEGKWRFVAYLDDGEWVEVLETGPSELTVEDGRLSGSAGVNRLLGSKAEVPLGPVAMTLMAGPQELMDQEHKIVGHLNEATEVVSGMSGMFLLVEGLAVLELVREGTKEADPHV